MNIKKFVRSTFIIISLFGLAGAPAFLMPKTLFAASVTSLSDTLTRIKASTASNHEIFFVTPTGVTSGQTITVTFSADFTNVASIIEDDVDFASGSTSTCTSATYTEQTTVASGATASQWNVSSSGQVITIESGGGSATVASSKCVRIRIGTNATNSGTGANQISNGAADDDDNITIGGTFADSGTATIDIIADDQVVITATVAPTFTFTIDDNAIGFGALSASTGRWATANASGVDASATTPTAANVLTVATNAASGWTLTYSGATLTSGGNTITDAATIDEDSDGTPGTEQFGISASTNGDSTIATGYLRDSAADFDFVPNTTTTLASEAVATATETISISYLANISGATEPGSYSTTLTYIATGNF
jgi:hypothetical protein